MRHSNLLDLVRQHVRQMFRARAVQGLEDCCETILIRDGLYCGRRFTFGDHRAIWFLEEQVIKFYGTDGEFLCSQAMNALVPRESSVA